MVDYVAVLVEALEEDDREYLGWEYFVQSERAMEALEALNKTLSPVQKRLFEKYEEKHTAANDARETALARRLFLLAREIYR